MIKLYDHIVSLSLRAFDGFIGGIDFAARDAVCFERFNPLISGFSGQTFIDVKFQGNTIFDPLGVSSEIFIRGPFGVA